MPRKSQGWITFQASAAERQILDDYCQRNQRSKTDILRELVRGLEQRDGELQAESATAVPFTTEPPEPSSLQVKQDFAISARNLLRTTVTAIASDGVNVELTLTAAPGVEVIAMVTLASVKRLNLAEGKEVYAVIKANSVMVAAVAP
ncbi:TOBE domain-containing protein [Nodosilinea sp. PGN35]|uniref:TOBE domain-containing protein n=1 Tax=Nodosilinea sp. PGN35 TaxID=3020489 RepID=UPI0023B258E6|nr:molybdopterin-binding protein [Nodosilinea sp. TSF1-S3]MDF0366269.1 molybdopterin-binding protein [Nodosilinea sp. TSF1-S3]